MPTIESARRISAISFSILFILLASPFQSSSSSFSATVEDPLRVSSNRTLVVQRSIRQRQIPNCSEMVSISHCSGNPKCRWCRSEVLDDMCFSKAEAWRLPQEVFVCD